MKSDLYFPSANLTGEEIDEVSQLVARDFDRTRAERFALQNCIFLAFDDPHVETSRVDTKGKGVDSMKGSAASRNAATTSNTLFLDNNDHDDGTHSSPSSSEQPPANQNFSECGCTKSPPGKVCSPSQCEVCWGVPEFPSHDNVRTLRQVRPQEYFQHGAHLPLCPHFLAVSYCRSGQTNLQAAQHQEKDPHQSYQIRTLDGTLRKNRAPDHIIDMAIAACRVVGYKLIWIDQESFANECHQGEGDGRESKLETTRDWDFLFQISHKTAGLLSVEIWCPEELGALGFLLDNCNTIRSLDESRRSEVVYHVANLFSRITQDSWYTCGSTLTEAINAQEDLILVIHRDTGMDWSDVVWPPPRCRVSLQKYQHQDVICLPLIDFQKANLKLWSYLESAGGLAGSRTADHRLRHPALSIVQTTAKLHPLVRSTTMGVSILVAKSRVFTPGPRADAAAALTLLKERVFKDDSHFFSVLADLCLYETRYSADSIETFDGSLRAAVLQLALLNGDLSLLVPEAYSLHNYTDDDNSLLQYSVTELTKPESHYTSVIDEQLELSPQWLSPFDMKSSAIDFPVLHRANFVRHGTTLVSHSPRPVTHFEFSAYLWDVESLLDLAPIRAKWRETWVSLRQVCMTLLPLEGETLEESMLRPHLLFEHLNKEDTAKAIKEDLIENGALSELNPFWNKFSRAGVDISLVPLADQVERDVQARQVLISILFDILEFLHEEAREGRQPLAQGVANSIWHSMRVGALSRGNQSLPDEVGPELFEHPDILTRASETVRFHKSPKLNGEYYQVWLLDRIISKGELWVGRFRRETLPMNEGDSGRCSEGSLPPPAKDHDRLETVSEFLPPRKSHEFATAPGPWPSSFLKKGKGKERADKSGMQRQRRNTIFAGLMEIMTRDGSTEGEVGQSSRLQNTPSIATGKLLAFMLRASELEDGARMIEEDEQRQKDLVSVFDVDGPCLIATPYSSEWEVLPHPEYRSMSICWVVEPAGGPAPRERGERVEPSVNDEGKFTTSNTGKDSHQQPFAEDVTRKHFEPSIFNRGKYRVINKVRGMWEIMELPWQTYIFS